MTLDEVKLLHAWTGQLPDITDKLFHESDNFIVVYADSRESLAEASPGLLELLRGLGEPAPRLFYHESAQEAVWLFKGMRRQRLPLPSGTDKLDMTTVIDFFQPRTEATLDEGGLSHDSFREISRPFLLVSEMAGCAGCVSLQPFVPVLRKLLPVPVHTLNLSRNDFPPGCPVSRVAPGVWLLEDGKETYLEEFDPVSILRSLTTSVDDETLSALQEEWEKRQALLARLVSAAQSLGAINSRLVSVCSKRALDNPFDFVPSALFKASMLQASSVDESNEQLQRLVEGTELDGALLSQAERKECQKVHVSDSANSQ
ncbi:MAG: uncharacterized protein KVP18_001155 [Porospora cf. gigantea A]|uniref:uncharacterized protein n=1 Tax=Porospora cf. gigantea A TaxID=2853593 RepID=UPI0035594739|nr:MAG: hypothetical protein KVP18_001155 [Porospora cf. gigantea A]